MRTLKLPLIISGVVIAVLLFCVMTVFSAQNKAISLCENVLTAQADINTEEKRRVDLVYNLADCVKQYDKHESETLTEIAGSMNAGNSDQKVESVQNTITAIAYAYPELKSNENYKQFMKELSTTENLIAQHRKNYNAAITSYNRYVRSFPASAFLNVTGYQIESFERTDFNVSSDAPQDLFNGDN